MDQRGDGVHLFAPMGYLDETWFHRSYWVYGKAFAGGHNGYYQAGKFAPAGQILVFDDKLVYSFGRKPEYLKWTTTMEYHLFATSKEAPEPKLPAVDRKGQPTAPATTSMIRIEKSKSLDPTGKALAVEAWVKADKPDGAVFANGGPAQGYALIVQGGKPAFVVRVGSELFSAMAAESIVGKWTHLAGVLAPDKQAQIYVNGKLAAKAPAAWLESEPKQPLEIGADNGSAVGDYQSPFGFTGLIDEVKVYRGALSAADIEAHCSNTKAGTPKDATLVLACSFDKGDAVDSSGNQNNGTVSGARASQGRVGGAMQFTSGPGGSQVAGKAGKKGGKKAGKAGLPQPGYLIKDQWSQEPPIIVRAMVLAGQNLFVAGPPELEHAEETFKKIMARDQTVQARLAEQDAALDGKRGGLLWAFSAKDGAKLKEYRLDSPPTWDGMAAANGRLYLTTLDGKVLCYAAP